MGDSDSAAENSEDDKAMRELRDVTVRRLTFSRAIRRGKGQINQEGVRSKWVMGK